MPRPTSKALRAAALLHLLGACGAPTPAPTPPSAPVSSLPPARWIVTDGWNAPPIARAEGTVALDHGRLLVAAKGATPRFAPVTEAGALARILEVPSRTGPRLFGVSTADQLLRLDAPFGEIVPVASPGPRCQFVMPLPGSLVCIRDGLVDVDTGTARPLSSWPWPEATAAANANEGAALFPVFGLMVTGDGGATWRFARPARDPRDAYAATGLRAEGGALFAVRKDGEARIDVAAATFGAFERKPGPAAPTPALYEEIGFDPLATAVVSGAAAPDLGAGPAPVAGLIAVRGQLLRVDLATGAVTAVTPLPAAWASASRATCTVRRARDDLWITCPLDGSLGVAHADLRRTPITLDPPESFAAQVTELRVSPGGGALVVLRDVPPSGERLASVLVHQPDGTWTSLASAGVQVRASTRLAGRVAPLADGRAVDLALDEPARFVLLDASGTIVDLPPLGREVGSAATPIEEDADHRLHAVLRGSEPERALFTVVQPIAGAAPPTLIPIAGARAVVMSDGRGVAVVVRDKDQPRALGLLSSTDGGVTWGALPAPSLAFGALSVATPSHEDRPLITVGPLGARVSTVLRLGWGPGADAEPSSPAPAPPPPAPAAPAKATEPFAFWPAKPPVPAPDPGKRILSCSPSGNATEVPSILEQLPDSKQPPGVRREGSGTDTNHLLPETPLPTGWFLSEGRSPAGGKEPPPTRHRLFWSDPTEFGGKMHTWSGALRLPPSVGEGRVGAMLGWDLDVERVAVRGDRVLFSLRGPGGRLLVRAHAGGKAEAVAVDAALDPAGDDWNKSVANAALSSEDESVAYVAGGVLHAWPAGRGPRAVAVVPSEVAVGAPTREGIPLLARVGQSSLLFRVVPIPAEPASGAPPVLPPLDWAVLSHELSQLQMEPCPAHAEGARFVLAGAWAALADIFPYPAFPHDPRPRLGAFVVHLSEHGGCLDGLHVMIPTPVPVYDRIDLVHARAERGTAHFTERDRADVGCTWRYFEAPPPRTAAPLPAALTPQQSACDGGDRHACVTLGETLYNGHGVARDPVRALPLFQKACDAGEPAGCVDLGWAHASGTGVDKNGAVAATFFAKACGGAVSVGCLGLGVLHRDGNGVPQDSTRAAALFKQACDVRVPAACEMLKAIKP